MQKGYLRSLFFGWTACNKLKVCVFDTGVTMKLMDEVAGIVAARHCNTNIVTASVDAINFHRKIKKGEDNTENTLILLNLWYLQISRDAGRYFCVIIAFFFCLVHLLYQEECCKTFSRLLTRDDKMETLKRFSI